jgi:multidrug efflux pump subunit AcrA (membrane-fusion protein)
MKRTRRFIAPLLCAAAWAQSPELVPVVSKQISRTTELPGEIQPYLTVALHARVAGYIDRITVDRGSAVDQGQVLAELSAPELKAAITEAESRVQEIEAERAQAEAQLAAAQSTADRLKKAAETPGAIAGNELIQAQKQVEAAQALVRSRQEAARTAQAAVQSRREMEAYLRNAWFIPVRWWVPVPIQCCS